MDNQGFKPLPISNFIQGVSQQAASQRRLTQLEEQYNCVNSPVDGVCARPSAELLAHAVATPADWEDAFYRTIRRGNEKYLIVIPGDGTISAYNLGTDGLGGFQSAGIVINPVNAAAIEAYLTTVQDGHDAFVAQSVSDFLFIGNREVETAMAADTTAARPYEAMFHFKAGNYLVQYAVTIRHNGVTYKYKYKTPDNSVVANASYITSNHLAATFYRAMTGGSTANHKYPVPDPTYLQADGLNGQEYYGAGGSSTGTATQDLTLLGFSVFINGNTIHIYHEDDPFTIDSDDGAGNTTLICFQQFIQTFAKLPLNAFAGYPCRVQGDKKSGDDDYWVQYSVTGAAGSWIETVAPDIPYQIDAETMPIVLVNDGLNSFTLDLANWGDRVVGDEESDPDPNFIGSTISDLCFNDQRLGIMTEGAIQWSKTGNALVFLRSTVQTDLANDPIGFDIEGKDTPILQQAIVSNELTSLWSQGTQFAVRTVDAAFKTENISIKPAMNYNFAEHCRTESVGQSFYFASEAELIGNEEAYGVKAWVTIRDLLFQKQEFVGDNNVTAHVPHYIPRGVNRMSASDLVGNMMVHSINDNRALFNYAFMIEDNERIQSAWNKWTFDNTGKVLWFEFDKSALTIFFLSEIIDGSYYVYHTRMNLSPNHRDFAGDYHTRLDLRVDQTFWGGFSFGDPKALAYDFDAGTSSFWVPFKVTEGNLDDLVVIQSSQHADTKRGHQFQVLSVDEVTNRVTVQGNLTLSFPDLEFYVGWRIPSYMVPSRPYVPGGENGNLIYEKTVIGDFTLTHSHTGYYRIEVNPTTGNAKTYSYEARELAAGNNIDEVAIKDDNFTANVGQDNDEFTLIVINDSPLPSRWQAGQWTYKATTRLNHLGA